MSFEEFIKDKKFLRLFKQKNINFIINKLSENSEAEFDNVRMVQVLINLLSNAVKFSDKDGVVKLNILDNSEGLLCEIVDSGVEIPDDELEAVFDKFIQSSKTKTGAGGTGLGLSICKEIIAAHKGSIWAENNQDKGAKFCFIIPRQQS
jgi:signal transduction histidine kinase